MPDAPDEQVTPTANPDDEQVAGSQPGQTQDDETPPASGSTSDTPEAYKGMQRLVAKKDRELAEANARLLAYERNSENDELTKLDEQRKVAQTRIDAMRADPEQVDQVANLQDKLNASYATRKLELTEQQLEQTQQYAEYERVEAGNVTALRDLASALGADPDSPMIEYGDPSKDYLSDRMTLVRESARAAMAPAAPVTPPTSNIADGSAHNSNPGSLPNTDTPAPTPIPSMEEVSKLMTARANNPSAENRTAVADAQAIRKVELEKQLAASV